MKMITNEQTLRNALVTISWAELMAVYDVQTNNAKRNDKVGVEDVRNSEREAQKYAQHSGPDYKSVYGLDVWQFSPMHVYGDVAAHPGATSCEMDF